MLSFFSGHEEEGIVVLEFDGAFRVFVALFKVFVVLVERLVVCFGEVDWLLDESDLSEQWGQFDGPLTDVVVLLEQVKVPGL